MTLTPAHRCSAALGAVLILAACSGLPEGGGTPRSGPSFVAHQPAVPTHFGIPDGIERVDVLVRWYQGGRVHFSTVRDLDPFEYVGRVLEIRTGEPR